MPFFLVQLPKIVGDIGHTLRQKSKFQGVFKPQCTASAFSFWGWNVGDFTLFNAQHCWNVPHIQCFQMFNSQSRADIVNCQFEWFFPIRLYWGFSCFMSFMSFLSPSFSLLLPCLQANTAICQTIAQKLPNRNCHEPLPCRPEGQPPPSPQSWSFFSGQHPMFKWRFNHHTMGHPKSIEPQIRRVYSSSVAGGANHRYSKFNNLLNVWIYRGYNYNM